MSGWIDARKEGKKEYKDNRASKGVMKTGMGSNTKKDYSRTAKERAIKDITDYLTNHFT